MIIALSGLAGRMQLGVDTVVSRLKNAPIHQEVFKEHILNKNLHQSSLKMHYFL